MSGRDEFADDVLERLARSEGEYQRAHGHYIVPLSERLLAARRENQRLRDALTEACDWLDDDLASAPDTSISMADRELVASWRAALDGTVVKSLRLLDRWRHRIPFWWWLTYDALVGIVIAVGISPSDPAFWLGFAVLFVAVVIDFVEFLVKRPKARAALDGTARRAEIAHKSGEPCAKCGYKGNARPCPDPECPSRAASDGTA